MQKVIIEMLQEREFSDADELGKPMKKRKFFKGKKYEVNSQVAKHVLNAGWAIEVKTENKKPKQETSKKTKSRSKSNKDSGGVESNDNEPDPNSST